jgi:hypothetical protein
MCFLTGVGLAAFVCGALATEAGGMAIDADFENGHLVKYQVVEPDTISIGPLNGNRDRWFSFRLRGVKHRKVNFVFEWQSRGSLDEVLRVAANDTAMVTYDGKGYEIIKGVEFRPKTPGATSGNYVQSFSHVFREDEARVAYCAPWSNATLAQLAEELKADPRVAVDSIGNSRFRDLPLTYFRVTDGSASDKPKKKILIVAREDSYEAGGSWAAEGMLRFLLSEDPVAKEMLKRTVFCIFPIFSVDGVAMGHTNFPLNPDGSDYVYVTAKWDVEPSYHEVRLMKDFWSRLKAAGEEVDILFRCHATCYFQPHFRPGDCSEERKGDAQRLMDILTARLPWRVQAGLHSGEAFMGYHLLQVFPGALTYSSHNDFVFTAQYLGTERAAIRRHEDVMQDGELIARAFAEFYGIESKAVPPYLMAGDVDMNNARKGEATAFTVYYYDLNGLPPTRLEVVVNGKPYAMQADAGADYRKPVRFQHQLTLAEPVNDYYFMASNGRQERRIPEGYQLPGPFLVE